LGLGVRVGVGVGVRVGVRVGVMVMVGGWVGVGVRVRVSVRVSVRVTFGVMVGVGPSKLPALLAACRMSVHSSTATTPNHAMLGSEVLLSCTFIAPPPHDTVSNAGFVTDLRINLREAHQRICESQQTSARTDKRYFDHGLRYQRFHVDQLVWLYWPRPLIRSSYRKLVKM